MAATRALGWLAVAAFAAGCDAPPPAGLAGYVEAETVRVAAPVAGTLARLDVARGQQVAAGTPLFVLESAQEAHARAEAQARLARAQAALANLEKGRRAPEVASVEAQLAQAQAALRASEATLERARRLVAEKFLPPQQYDEALAQRDRDRARSAELAAQVQVAKLPARSDEIAAARAEAVAAAEALAQAQWRLDQKAQGAPVAGLVEDTLYRPGEWVGAGVPVVSLLPPGNVKVRFYVPEPHLAAVAPGAAATVRCDGCGAPIPVRVDYVAPQAEYTPPVIYSRENRAKLVFLVEARPAHPVGALRPGLPVEVTLGP
ncbi:MAG: HlyD family efflux transporter periplasmic adaptor subunit [Burkholderiales bacterium]|nr:HlyD family efflux transporter periplasmic adaptor subunit [Burkholderiales bacterium]GIK85804.1 MAG: secretion protein HlyD [Betaproteobacteria bacterium]